MSALLVQIVRFARKTCDPLNTDGFAQNLLVLRQLCDRLTARDLHIPVDVLDRRPPTRPPSASFRPNGAESFVRRPAPCTYIPVLDHHDLTISVFILHAGQAMPLHDHPRMHGILKPIHGRGTIESFSAVAGPDEAADAPEVGPLQPLVRREPAAKLHADQTSLLLTPDRGNFHRICADPDRPVAFFDILFPPYRSTGSPCTYYVEQPEHPEGKARPDTVRLRPVECPATFWCDEHFVLDDIGRDRLLASDD